MFEEEIKKYDAQAARYRASIAVKMSAEDLARHNEVLFSAHSCAIEGNSFTVNDTRELKEKGLGLIPKGKTLLEAFEMLDHFSAYEYLTARPEEPLSEALLKETHRRLTEHTLPYRCPDSVPGEYTDKDMCAGDTVFGEHQVLVGRVPALLESTQRALDEGSTHPMMIAARFHGYFEYLHPFRDGNGRLGRLFSNFILQKKDLPPVIIRQETKQDYIDALRAIRTEGTDEYLIAFFFQTACRHMEDEMDQKRRGSRIVPFLF